MKIHKLPKDVINKIAAGEVVERPASVVKELVENSLDAGASEIFVSIKNGGKDYIKVQDNGCGMEKADAELAVEQHATSKIYKIEDLFQIQSFGFRGEALASISSVSDFVLRTKTADQLEGVEIKVENNQKSIDIVSCKVGTKIEVKNLFKNIPARRQFLKSVSTEYNHILNTFLQFALSHPQVCFKLENNGKLVYNLQAVNNLLERIEQIFKQDITESLIAVKAKQANLEINGYIGKPSKFSHSRLYQFLFVNKRFVKSSAISKAIVQAYDSLIPQKMHPIFILNLFVDPKEIDVNVHPRKLEVKFTDQQQVFSFVLKSLKNVLAQSSLNKIVNISDFQSSKSRKTYKQPTIKTSFNLQQSKLNNISQPGVIKKSVHFFQTKAKAGLIRDNLEFSKQILNTEQDQRNWVLLGQVKNSYLLVEDFEKGLLIIDQHGAHERVNYEKLKKQFLKNKFVKKQNLLLPLTFDFSFDEKNDIMKYKEDFEKAGFEIESFGKTTISVNTVPTIIQKKDPKQIVDEIFASVLNESEVKSWSIDYLLKTIACKSAIKFGDKLSFDEQMKLVTDLFYNIDNQQACAHGRPIILELSWNKINNLFERS